ncbi:MAG: hypothetical protein ABIQ44_05290 [Chloroflexia bacterium]
MIRRVSTQLGFWLLVFGLLYSVANLAKIIGVMPDDLDRLTTVLVLAFSLCLSVIGLFLLLRDPAVRGRKFRTWGFAPRSYKASPLFVVITLNFLAREMAAYARNIIQDGRAGPSGFIWWLSIISVLVFGACVVWMIMDSRKLAQTQDKSTIIN